MSERNETTGARRLGLSTNAAAPTAPKSLLTVEDIARILKLKPKQVYNLKIPCIRVSRRAMRFDPDTFQEWLQARAS